MSATAFTVNTPNSAAAAATQPSVVEGRKPSPVSAVEFNPFSPQSILPTEDRIAFERLGAMLIEIHEPSTALELNLISEIHEADWRLRRLNSIEKGIHTLGVQRNLEQAAQLAGDPALAPGLADALGYQQDVKIYEQIGRQCGRLYRLRTQLLESFAGVKNRRLQAEREKELRDKHQEESRITHELANSYLRKNGFVPVKLDNGSIRPPQQPPTVAPADFLPGHVQRDLIWSDVLTAHCNYTRKNAA